LGRQNQGVDVEVVLVRRYLAAVTAAAVVSSPAAAQEKPLDPEILPGIPASALPPEGMCRVWLKDVPATRQPAPTDCASAIKTRPRDAILLIGDQGASAKPPARSPVNPLRPQKQNDLVGRMPGISGAERAVLQMQQQRVAGQAGGAAPQPGAAGAAGGATATAKAPDAKAAVVAKPPE
jgi:hypothetical protein